MKYLEAIRSALREALREDKRVILLGEDIRDPYGGSFKVTKGLSTEFPERVINTPISEASITGVATGMALRGMRPVLELMFGDFLMLCADQFINHASKFRWMYNDSVTVPMVIRVPMGGYRGYGPTHSQTTERLLFGFPGVKILAPSHFHNVAQLMKVSIESEDLILFVEHKLLYPEDIVEFESGASYQDLRILRVNEEGRETVVLSSCEEDEDPAVTLITYGGMSPMALSASRKALIEEEITCEVVIPSLIKPLQLDAMKESVRKSGKALVIEEGHLSWGWGAEVAAKLTEGCYNYLKAPVKRVAAEDLPIPCSRTLENEVLPKEEDILRELLKLVQV